MKEWQKQKTSNTWPAPRVYRNTIIFLAPDSRAIESVRDEMRREIAWQQVVNETDRLNQRVKPHEQQNNIKIRSYS